MHELLLMRHAAAAFPARGVADPDRPLNARGRRAAAAMAGAMRELGLQPDLVLVSSSRRTLQTLEALTPFEDNALIEPTDALYLASAPQLMDAVRRTPETVRSLLLIGHNPGLHELALALADRDDRGDAAASAALLRSVEWAQAHLGSDQTFGGERIDGGVVAASSPLDTGFGFAYLPNLHTGATSWYVMAALGANPYRFVARGR